VTRRVVINREVEALDAVVREYAETEERLRQLEVKMKRAAIEAVRAGLSRAEAGRRAGWSREYVSRFVNEANRREGWVSPKSGDEE
jgi:hypothetical protein